MYCTQLEIVMVTIIISYRIYHGGIAADGVGGSL